MKYGYGTFFYGGLLNGPDNSISKHLITKQVKVPYSDKLANQMFAIQIPTEHMSINACNRLAV